MNEFENKMQDALLSGCQMPDDLSERIVSTVSAQPKRRSVSPLLIAAMVALLVCGTAAGTWLWKKPDIKQQYIHISMDGEERNDTHTLLLGDDYITLPADALAQITANADPDRMYNSILSFDSVTEWQSFCDLPLALSPDLIFEDIVDMIVSHRKTEEGLKPMMLIAITTAEDSDGQHYSCKIQANLSPEAGGTSTYSYPTSTTTTTEITDYTTANGIPCVLCKVTDTEHGFVDLELYYTCNAVSYTLKCSAIHTADADMCMAKMQALADTLVVQVP